MINLKVLEEKLNKALENETQESLTNWLLQKRLKNVYKSMGEGNISALNERPFNIEKIGSQKFDILSYLIEEDNGWLLAS